MSFVNLEVIKSVGRYYNAPVGTVCYNTEKVPTTILNKQNVEGFASIILKLVSDAGINLSQEQMLLSYQWLEYIAMYANQAAVNSAFAQSFLKEINKALERNSYLTGQSLSVTDIATYYVLYPLIERLSISECESLIHLCRWTKHVQSQPKVCSNQAPIKINTLNLTILAPHGEMVIHKSPGDILPLPHQLLPHELKNISLDEPVVFHPQPFSYPGYPVILYL